MNITEAILPDIKSPVVKYSPMYIITIFTWTDCCFLSFLVYHDDPIKHVLGQTGLGKHHGLH